MMLFKNPKYATSIKRNAQLDLVCENCSKPLRTHIAFSCIPETVAETNNRLRRSDDWPYIGELKELKPATFDPPPTLNQSDLEKSIGFIDMLIFNRKLMVLTTKGLYFLHTDGDMKLVPVHGV